LVLFLNSLLLINAEKWKFNVVSIFEPEYSIGLKYNDKIIKMQSTVFPVFTVTIEPVDYSFKYFYKYVLLDKNGKVIDEEKKDRNYKPSVSSTYEVYNRYKTNVKIPSLSKVYDTNFVQSTEKYQPYDDSQIYTVYAKCNENDYENLKYKPFLNRNTFKKNEGFANCTVSFVSQTEVFERNGALQLIGYDSRKYKKLSWKIKLDKKIFGRKVLKFRSNANDATMMRDKINTELYKALGVPTYSSAYARLTINDDVYGLYSLVDTISDNWIASAIHGNDKARVGYNYKTYSGATLKYINEISSSYSTGEYEVDEIDKEDTEASGNDWYRLIQFTKLFSNWNKQYSNQPNKVAFNALNQFFNIESLLRQMTIESLTYSFDNFWANSGNFALYYNPEEKRYQIIPYDYDGSFYGSNDSPRFIENYLKESMDCIEWAKKARIDEDYYFINALFAHDSIKNRYNKIMKDTLEKVFNVKELSILIDALYQLIVDEVEWNFGLIDELDENIPGYVNHFTLQNFNDNTNYKKVKYNKILNYNDANFGLKQWIKDRGEECQIYVKSVVLDNDDDNDNEIVNAEPEINNRKTTTTTTTAKATATTSKGVPKSTHPYKCGPDWGACYVDGECCSRKGYCGTTKDYCGSGCQSEFGVCGVASTKKKTTTKTTTTTTTTRTTSKKKTTTFTTLIKKTTTSSSTSTTTSKGVPKSTHPYKCGPNWGACYVDGECCSRKGYCGTTKDYCGSGCQSEFGVCGIASTTKKTTTKTTTTRTTTTSKNIPISTVSGKCGSNYGACPNSYCCSKYGYCGLTDEYCGKGCQIGYGQCH
jgi:hypothetical protein